MQEVYNKVQKCQLNSIQFNIYRQIRIHFYNCVINKWDKNKKTQYSIKHYMRESFVLDSNDCINKDTIVFTWRYLGLRILFIFAMPSIPESRYDRYVCFKEKNKTI